MVGAAASGVGYGASALEQPLPRVAGRSLGRSAEAIAASAREIAHIAGEPVRSGSAPEKAPLPVLPNQPAPRRDGAASGGLAGGSAAGGSPSALTAVFLFLVLAYLGAKLSAARAGRWRVAVVSPLERPPGLGLL